MSMVCVRNKLMLLLLLLALSKLTYSSPPPLSPTINPSRISGGEEKYQHISQNGPSSGGSHQFNTEKHTSGSFDFLKPPPPHRRPVVLRYSHPPPVPPPSFMERIVSWFGFGGNSNDNVTPHKFSNTPPQFPNEPQPQFSASQPTFLMPHGKFRQQGPPQGHSQGPPQGFHFESHHGSPQGYQGAQHSGSQHNSQHGSNQDSHHSSQPHESHHGPPTHELHHGPPSHEPHHGPSSHEPYRGQLQQQQQHQQKQHNSQDQQTEECSLCNQFPWIPMFPGHSQLPVLRGNDQPDAHQQNFHFQHYQSGQHNTISFTTSIPSKSEPERFTAPHGSIGITSPEYLPPRGVLPIEQEKHRLIPIPVPNLSVTPIPPLYNAKPFKSQNGQFSDSSHPYKFYEDTQPQLSSNVHHVHDSISNHLPSNAFEALSISDANLEIIKSIPVAHFTQSENYPIMGGQIPPLQYSGYYQQQQQQHQQNQHNQHNQHNQQNQQHYQSSYEVHSNGNQQNNHHADNHSGVNYNLSNNKNENNNKHESLGSNYDSSSAHQSSGQSHFQSNSGGEVINSHTEVIFKQNEKSNEHNVNSNTESHFTIPYNHKPDFDSDYNSHSISTISSDNEKGSEYIDHPIIVNNNHEGSSDSFAAASSHTIDSAGEETETPLIIVNKTEELFNGETYNATVETTTKSYIIPAPPKKIIETEVEFQASVQTAADKANSQNKKVNQKKDRETPKNLLDSPIYYLKGTSVKPYTANPSESLGTVSATLGSNNWTPIDSFTQQGFSNGNVGISESEQREMEQSAVVKDEDKKRPKQIQIIIPYTVNNKPSPFKMIDDQKPLNPEQFISYDKSLGWASHNDGQDYHIEQESKLVTATETPVRKTTKYLTKILASNIRDLLKKEQDGRHKSQPESFDIARLQKNIDGWTEQEFSDFSKASTISFLAPSKNIPEEYLTTSPATTNYYSNEEDADNDPDENPDDSEPSLSEEEEHRYDNYKQYLNENHLNEDSSEEDDEEEIVPMPTTEPSNMPTKELWKKLKVSISPLTNEKVYVVTPQPLIDAKNSANESIGQFKSPRFIIRPTPGNGSGHYALTLSLSKSINNLQTTRNPARAYYTPELFGLMGKSGYSPIVQSDVHDSNGKIITIVTPSELKDEDSR